MFFFRSRETLKEMNEALKRGEIYFWLESSQMCEKQNNVRQGNRERFKDFFKRKYSKS